MNKREKPPPNLQAVKINASIATCTPELEHLDKLAESLLLPFHRWGMRQSETVSGRAGLLSGDSWSFWLCACQEATISADQREARKAAEQISMVKKRSILSCSQSRTHPTHGPNPDSFALQRRASQGAAHFNSVRWKHIPLWDMHRITKNTMYRITFQNPFHQFPQFPTDRNLHTDIYRQLRAGRLRRSRRAVIQFGQELQQCPFSLFTPGCAHRWIFEVELAYCHLGSNCSKQYMDSWGKPALHGFLFCVKPTLWPATSSLHNPTPRFPPGDHICFPNVLSDTRPPTELHDPTSAHIRF